jgi:transcriptional regulator with XRE-family HTH domain
MNVTSPDPKLPPSELGDLLRYWRDVRGVSQLDLSLEASVSQRQISFIESGRSVPGRHTILSLAQTLDVPLRERNALLLAAGYAPVYSEAPWNAQEMHRSSIRRVCVRSWPIGTTSREACCNGCIANRLVT